MNEQNYKNRRWVFEDGVYKLHFAQFYDDDVILQFVQDKENENIWLYVSELLKVEQDDIFAENAEEAKEMFEEMIIEHLQDKIMYYEDMLRKFEGE